MSSSSSLSSSAATTTATATTAPQTSRLTTVFAIHRFIAGGFGCMLYFVPQILNESFGRTDNLPYGEEIALRSWGAFVIAVAIIVHSAQYFEYTAQLAVAWSLLICFLLLVTRYVVVLVTPMHQNNMPPQYLQGMILTGGTFLTLLVLYAWGLSENRSLIHLSRYFKSKRK